MKKLKYLSFLICFFLLTILMMSANITSALYPLYKNHNILNAFQITEVFAAYIIGLIPMLMLSNWISKKFRIRTLFIFSVIFAIIGILIIGIGSNFYSIFIGRILQGVSIGLSAGNISSTLIENSPNRNYKHASLATGIAMTIGGGGGPIIGAIIADHAKYPLLSPYSIMLLLLISIIPLLFYLKNSKTKINPKPSNIPLDIRNIFYTCAFSAFLCWSITAMFLSLIPVATSSVIIEKNLLNPALAASSILIISGITQILAIKLNPKFNIYSGFILLITSGIILFYSQVKTSSKLIILCSLVSGLGHGLTFLGATTLLTRFINHHIDKSQIMSSYNIFIYLGVGVPTLVIGSLTMIVSIKYAISIFSIYMIITSLIGIYLTKKQLYGT